LVLHLTQYASILIVSYPRPIAQRAEVHRKAMNS
jgi:hypothetical protein